jgi:hypothetical protein
MMSQFVTIVSQIASPLFLSVRDCAMVNLAADLALRDKNLIS